MNEDDPRDEPHALSCLLIALAVAGFWAGAYIVVSSLGWLPWAP